MTELLSPERKRAAFQGFGPAERIDNLRHGAIGAVVLCVLIAAAAWLAAHEHELSTLDFIGP